jgi:hypothetical protein
VTDSQDWEQRLLRPRDVLRGVAGAELLGHGVAVEAAQGREVPGDACAGSWRSSRAGAARTSRRAGASRTAAQLPAVGAVGQPTRSRAYALRVGPSRLLSRKARATAADRSSPRARRTPTAARPAAARRSGPARRVIPLRPSLPAGPAPAGPEPSLAGPAPSPAGPARAGPARRECPERPACLARSSRARPLPPSARRAEAATVVDDAVRETEPSGRRGQRNCATRGSPGPNADAACSSTGAPSELAGRPWEAAAQG